MMLSHQLSTGEASQLAREIGVQEQDVESALERLGMLYRPSVQAIDELSVLADVLEDVGLVNQGGETVQDACANTCVLAGALVRRIVPDLEAIAEQAGLEDAVRGVKA